MLIIKLPTETYDPNNLAEDMSDNILNLINDYSLIQEQYRKSESLPNFDPKVLEEINKIDFNSVTVSLGTTNTGDTCVLFK